MLGADDDLALVAAARAGDAAALDRLLRRHYDRIYAVCRRVTGHDADAADAAQEALMAVVRGLPRFDGRSSFGTWVYRIATNASLDELRRRRRRPLLAQAGGESPQPEPVDHASSAQLDAVATRSELDLGLAQLTEEFRVPVVLRDVADLDYAEIAAILDVPLGTVKSRIARGRAMLGAALVGNSSDDRERPRSAP